MKKIIIALLITLSLLCVSCEDADRKEVSVSDNFEIISKEKLDNGVTSYIVKDKVYENEYIMIYNSGSHISITPRLK